MRRTAWAFVFALTMMLTVQMVLAQQASPPSGRQDGKVTSVVVTMGGTMGVGGKQMDVAF